MRTPIRAALRLALAGFLGLAGLTAASPGAAAAAPPEKMLPDTTLFLLKANNVAQLRASFRQSQFGQLTNDPALKPFLDDMIEKVDASDGNKEMKEKFGVSIRELLDMPQGAASMAVIGKDNADAPTAFLLSFDVAQKADALAQVMTRATKESEESGAKVETVPFKNLTLHVITPPKPKAKANDDEKAEIAPPPMIWTHDGGVFTVASDLETLKDVLAHAGGREDSLAASESYVAAVKKLGAETPIFWFADLAKVIKLLPKLGAKGRNAQMFQQAEPMIQLMGLNGLKAAAGTYAFNSGGFDSVTKIFVLAPQPLQGLLKVFGMPRVNLRPEPWVPGSVATYQTISWDLDAAFVAINDLVNSFQPGALNVFEQQLVGPNGGDPLSFKKDIFDPLGDRVTVITDFKKPITEDSQRTLVGVALEDAEKFTATLGALINLSGATPKKREFQGTTIYDFEVGDVGNANVQIKGPVSVTIAKNTLFVSNEPTLLEQVLRGGASPLAETPEFAAFAKELPEKSSTMTYTRPDESARLSYDMIKSGQFEKALQGIATAGAGPDLSKVSKLYDKDKLPDFSVFAKYLAQGGGFTQNDDDGYLSTSFTLRKANP